jgi:hypothetical protein
MPERLFKALAGEKLLLSGGVCYLDSTMVKTHPDTYETEKGHTGDSEESWRMEREDTHANLGEGSWGLIR